ncbi:MAG TPA: hypothetical protein VLA19_01785, partial [Herpetosiphonaceae bacterium]|nr:hypothetical protein [Herpetosiphonaceae bacterium]
MEHKVEQARMDSPARAPGRSGRIILRVLALLLLVYAVVWSYSFTLAFLGPFGPLVFLLLVGLALLAATPALLSRYRGRLR